MLRRIALGFSLVAGLGFQLPEPAAKPEPLPEVCIIERHWSAEVDGQPAVLVELNCQRQGHLSLVLTK